MTPSMLSMPVQGEGTPYGTLGRLPLELRNEIYTLVLGKYWNLIHPKPDEISKDLGIMAASKGISSEAQEVFYSKSVFFVDADELYDNDDSTVPADRLINAQRMRCLELRVWFEDLFSATYWSMEYVSSARQGRRDYSRVDTYLVSFLDRGPAGQNLRLRLYFFCANHDVESPEEDAFFQEWVPTCKVLCRLKKVTVEWLHVWYNKALEEVKEMETCPYLQKVNSKLQFFLGPSRMEPGHDKRYSCSGILNFRPREHQARLCQGQQQQHGEAGEAVERN